MPFLFQAPDVGISIHIFIHTHDCTFPVSTLKSVSCSVGCVGVPAAVRGGALLPAEPYGEGAGALEAGARAAAGSSAL